MLEALTSWPIICVVLVGVIAVLMVHFGNNERKLYDQLAFLLLDDEEWSYAEDLVFMSHKALQPYKVHLVLGGLTARKLIERSGHGPDARSMYRRVKDEN